MGLLKHDGESWYTRLFRLLMNCYPMYFGTGGRITYIAHDFKEVKLALGLNPFTYNYVGTIFGGSMFAASDPFLMVMLLNILGKEKYVVWDKQGKIEFKRPGKERLSMHLKISDDLVAEIKEQVAKENKWTGWLTVEWKNKAGKVVARLERELYVADKSWYKKSRRERKASTSTA